METKKKNTVWQNLTSILNVYPTENINQSNQKIIIKGKSPEDIRKKALEIEQQKEISRKFQKLTDHGFQKAMQYEAARLPAYLDYEGMEYYPIIASALDLFMEEATTIGDDGKMLKIFSNKERIKEHLEEFFYETVDINVNLPFWVRNVCKYGDNFCYLMGEKKKGITHVKQVVNYEMERIERIDKGKIQVKFHQRETGEEFNIFEMAHFRLLGDDKYLPYGSSVLNKIRRVFRQLILAEDAMLTYRITRAGEKRVFKIDVGNIDVDDIESYVQKTMNRFKKQQQIYPDSGQIDYRFNILGVDEDYVLPVRNGNSQTGIDTLPGAQNLSDIHDIEYLRDNLFTGLSIPKPFLAFQDAAGEGKNLAQMDIRFSKKINRIQQAIIQELNKMAMIHLYLLGFDKDYNNFKLGLNNPSTQQEILLGEILQTKANVYSEITRNEGGIAAMSHTNAKKIIFNMSEKEIVEDFKIQRMERAISQELQDSPLVIRNTGLFNDIDDKYGTGEAPLPVEDGDEGEGIEQPDEAPLTGDDETAPQSPAELPPVIGQGQGFKPDKQKPFLTEKDYNNYVEKMVNNSSIKNSKIKKEDKKIINENKNKVKKLNEKAISMANEIDALIKENNNNSINQKDISADALKSERFENLVNETLKNIDYKNEKK